MQTILTLTEKDVYPDNVITLEENYIAPRSAVRVVIFDEENNVALEGFNSHEGGLVYCVIGGGIDEGEVVEEALMREAREEAGVMLTNIQELGIVEERGIGNKDNTRFIQTNYCFVADVLGKKLPPQFTPDELAREYHCVWMPLDRAISRLQAQSTGFMTRRTLFLLEEARKHKR